MQIQVRLSPSKQLIVPFNYNYQLQSAIYTKLAEIGASDFWHDIGFGEINKFKAFNFGPLKGKYKVVNNHIIFEDYVSFELRSPIYGFCDDFQRAIELFPDFKLFDTELKVTNASVFNKHINQNKALFFSETPIIIYTHQDDGFTKYFSPEDVDFFTGICNNYEHKYESIFNTTPEPIKIRPVGNYKKVVTKYKETWLTAYRVQIEVLGSSKSLEFLYNTGMGTKSSQGFGFLKLL